MSRNARWTYNFPPSRNSAFRVLSLSLRVKNILLRFPRILSNSFLSLKKLPRNNYSVCQKGLFVFDTFRYSAVRSSACPYTANDSSSILAIREMPFCPTLYITLPNRPNIVFSNSQDKTLYSEALARRTMWAIHIKFFLSLASSGFERFSKLPHYICSMCKHPTARC